MGIVYVSLPLLYCCNVLFVYTCVQVYHGLFQSAGETLDSLLAALEYLQQFLMTSMSTVALTKCLPALEPQRYASGKTVPAVIKLVS